MATTLDRLKFIISADASSAIQAFESMGREAEQNFEMASDRLDKMANKMIGFGATALAGAGLVGKQFHQMTVGASDLSETVNKTSVVFEDAFEDIDTFAKSAAKNLGTSRRQALDAAASIGLFGKSAGKSGKDLANFTTDLVQLSADLASFFNTSIPDAQAALSAALRGEMEPIRRYNVLLNDAALKSKAMAMGIYEGKGALTGQQKILAAYEEILSQTVDAQGDFARTADGYANSSRTLQANIQDLKDEVGTAFLPILENVTGVMANGVLKVNDLNKSTGGAIGTFTMFGTTAVALVGSLSLVAGMAIKVRTTLVDAEGNVNRLGRAAKVTSIFLGSLAVAEAAGQAIQQLGGFAKESESRLNRLLAVIDRAPDDSAEITTAFAELADQLKNADTGITAFWKQFGKAIRIAGADTDAGRIAIEYLDEAFTQIASKSPKLAQAIINSLAKQAQSLDKTKDTYKDNMMLIGRYQTQLNEMKAAVEAVDNAQEEANEESEEDAELKRKQEEAARRLQERLKRLRDAISGSILDAQRSANKVLEEARQKYDDYQRSVSDAIKSSYSFAGALTAVRAAQGDSAAAAAQETAASEKLAAVKERLADVDFDIAKAEGDLAKARAAGDSRDIMSAEERLNDLQRDRTKVLEDVTKAQNDLTAAQTTAQTAASEASKTFLDRLNEQATAATTFSQRVSTLISMGLTEQSLQQVLAAGTEAGTMIADELIAGGEAAINTANTLTESVKAAADRVGTEAADQWYKAGVDNAQSLVKGIDSVVKKYKIKLKSKNLTEKQLKKLKKQFAVDVDFQFVTRELEVPEAAQGGIVRSRAGGQLVRVAEAGQDEAIIPLPNGMRNIGSGGDVYNITINSKIADETLPDLLVAELRKFNRRSGAINIQVQ